MVGQLQCPGPPACSLAHLTPPLHPFPPSTTAVGPFQHTAGWGQATVQVGCPPTCANLPPPSIHRSVSA